MKWLLLFALVGCASRFEDFAFIKKSEFNSESHQPATARPPKLMAGKKETEKFCEGQIFFNKNANKITEASLPALVAQSCPGSEYLLNARITRVWWTLLLYSRSCVEVESFCPQKK